MLDGLLSYLMSGTLLDEYSKVLCFPCIMRLHGRTDGETDQLLTVLAANATWRQPPSAASALDTGDDHLWGILASQPGSRLVTGDRRLLERPPQPERCPNPSPGRPHDRFFCKTLGLSGVKRRPR